VETVDVAVIGGGVVGLAAARAIARPDRTVCLLERHPRFGLETSTHNSGVIHAGIYYPPGTLKARLCVEGNAMLYEYCGARNVPHKRIGKIILAEPDQHASLEKLAANGTANGVEGLTLVDEAFVRRREPHVRHLPGLFSPNTGIVETEALVRALAADCSDRGVALLAGTALERADFRAGAFELQTPREVFRAKAIVNAAGLYADEVSRSLDGDAFTIYPARGEYAEVVASKRHLVNGLVYPLPGTAGHLGLHLTRTIQGNVLLGPNIRYQTGKADYEHDRSSVEELLEHARYLLPSLTSADLRLAGSGIRAKLHLADRTFADFLIRADSRQPRLIHAAGIDSPGLTSSLAIGAMVARLVDSALR
jgi:L-2-hydroxyglutarate oxidase LhgO